MMSRIYRPIGIIHTAFTTPENMSIQNAGTNEETGSIDIFPSLAAGLENLRYFSHIILLFHLHE
ncbi:MAG: hypothetical protein LWX56_11005 [Ignavibacteria bacterium]|nr:hypothetical protein [Ignavibacteria bacterium]